MPRDIVMEADIAERSMSDINKEFALGHLAPVTQFFLEDLGHSVEIASNGEQGLAIARQTKPDVIISDIGLTAAMDGYTVAKTL